MHLFSESGIWVTESEFVTPDGTISKASGESEIILTGETLENRSWVMFNRTRLENHYSIQKKPDSLYSFVCQNSTLGTQTGTISIDRNSLYSKFVIEKGAMDGFEVTIRNRDSCEAYGALYKKGALINTWRAFLKLKRS